MHTVLIGGDLNQPTARDYPPVRQPCNLAVRHNPCYYLSHVLEPFDDLSAVVGCSHAIIGGLGSYGKGHEWGEASAVRWRCAFSARWWRWRGCALVLQRERATVSFLAPIPLIIIVCFCICVAGNCANCTICARRWRVGHEF